MRKMISTILWGKVRLNELNRTFQILFSHPQENGQFNLEIPKMSINEKSKQIEENKYFDFGVGWE